MLLTVDFTSIQNQSPSGDSKVYIYVGLTDDIDDIYSNSIPIVLSPGVHLRGQFHTEIRQTFEKDFASLWGVFPVSN